MVGALLLAMIDGAGRGDRRLLGVRVASSRGEAQPDRQHHCRLRRASRWLSSPRNGPYRFWDGYVVVDTLGAWIMLCTAARLLPRVGLRRGLHAAYRREQERLYRFYALFAGFALTTLLGPMMNNAGSTGSRSN